MTVAFLFIGFAFLAGKKGDKREKGGRREEKEEEEKGEEVLVCSLQRHFFVKKCATHAENLPLRVK